MEATKATCREMRKRGIRVVPGGDYGFAWTPQGTNARDLQHFVELFGYSPVEAVLSATKTGGELMARGDELGQIREGYLPDGAAEVACPSRRWLGSLHASAVKVGGRCLVFPGERGSGKTTLAAALVAGGAEFVTDDYAPFEKTSWHVWPVPYAPGIKQGSWRSLSRHYPELGSLPVHHLAGLRIRYLQLEPWRRAPQSNGLSVSVLVFPRYKPGAGVEKQRLTAAEALIGICHARSMLDRPPDVLAETLRWVESVPAYRLAYGDLDRAVEWCLSPVPT